ncbi:hypothetical protein B0H10DRAFT_1954589 [Mycena sp. CBHHK59/15]|nr:hypothetical protein B0H10DRAFT_1954589 [Mycena sp. CBHHK59/15]
MPSLTVKLLSLAQRIASGHYKGSADEDEDDNKDEDAEYEDTGVAVRLCGGVWTRDCVRKGDAVRVGGDQDIGRVNCLVGDSCPVCGGGDSGDASTTAGGGEGRNNGGHEEPEDGQGRKQKRKRKQKNFRWRREDTGGPVVTRKAGEVLSRLLTISLPHHCQAMESILADLENSFKDVVNSSNTVETSVAVVEGEDGSHVAFPPIYIYLLTLPYIGHQAAYLLRTYTLPNISLLIPKPPPSLRPVNQALHRGQVTNPYPTPARQFPLPTLNFYFTLVQLSWDHFDIFCFTCTPRILDDDPIISVPKQRTRYCDTVVNQFALNVKKNELGYMLALIQLTMNVDSLKCDSKKKNLSKPKMTEITEKYAPDISRTTFNDWLSCGQKLTLLCAGGTLYLLPIIAALDMRTCITQQCGEEDILSIANTLREVKHRQWLPLVKHLMIPIQFLHGLKDGILPQLPLFYNVPKPVGEAPETYQYHFCNIVQLDTVFDSIETNYPKLPARSLEWDSQTIPSPYWSSLQFQATPSRPHRDTWTEWQRSVAERAEVALNLKDLEDKLNVNHAGGKRKRNFKPLFIRDANDKLLSLVLTVPDAIHQSLEDAILHLEAAMPGEFREEDSQREKFKYYSCHYTWYNRFGEKGFTAPANVHPNNIRNDHDGQVNFTQSTKPRRLLNTGRTSPSSTRGRLYLYVLPVPLHLWRFCGQRQRLHLGPYGW